MQYLLAGQAWFVSANFTRAQDKDDESDNEDTSSGEREIDVCN